MDYCAVGSVLSETEMTSLLSAAASAEIVADNAAFAEELAKVAIFLALFLNENFSGMIKKKHLRLQSPSLALLRGVRSVFQCS